MKTITETTGGAQVLLDISFELQSCFEDDKHINIIRFLYGHRDSKITLMKN
jgi:hypothetical protein